MNDESKAVNSFTISMLEDMDEDLPKILANEKIEGIVIKSSKKNCFAAGADISIFNTFTVKMWGKRKQRIASYCKLFCCGKIPTVAAIHGTCLEVV